MIDETILCLSYTGFGDSRLKKYEQEFVGMATWDLDIGLDDPLRKMFSKVLRYDFEKSYAESGVSRTNNEIIELVRAQRPKYVLWPSMSYEILESTFQAIRKEGAFVIGWFFDDECRFDDHSRWWIPYLDYCLTNDKESVKKYRELGATAMHMLVTSNPEVFRRLEVEKRYDVSFVGSKIADRESLVNKLMANGIQVQTFGRGWSSGYVSLDEMVNIYNATKINLCFVKSYGVNTRPQMKNKIFDICMCGGFLLCEYIPGIEDFFVVGKEIVCFRDIEEATAKIRYYLNHDVERQAIAQAGWERAQRDHDQFTWLLRIFEEIGKDTKSGKRRVIDHPGQLGMPRHIRRLPSLYHLRWAEVLMMEGYDRNRWQEELDLALSYDPENVKARWLSVIGRLPAFVRPGLIRLLAVLGRLKRALPSRLATIPILRKSSILLNKCRSLSMTILNRSVRYRSLIIPSVSPEEQFPGISQLPVTLSDYIYNYGDMPVHEILTLCQIVRWAKPECIFEIGTFQGGTTLQMATNSSAKIYTLDLPPETGEKRHVWDADLDVYPEISGARFHETGYAQQIHQLFGDSQTFDFTPYYRRMDIVFVDACHHYKFVKKDSENALKMVSPNGIIIWHDYYYYAPGVVQALNELSTKKQLFHLSGTSLVIHCLFK